MCRQLLLADTAHASYREPASACPCLPALAGCLARSMHVAPHLYSCVCMPQRLKMALWFAQEGVGMSTSLGPG